MLLDSSFTDCVVFEKTSHTAVLSFRSRIKSGMTDPESTVFLLLCCWMPDQVRHDGQKLNDFSNYDTVCFAGMTDSDRTFPCHSRETRP